MDELEMKGKGDRQLQLTQVFPLAHGCVQTFQSQ